MKLRALEGQFGTMNGRKIEFTDGFSHLELPSGWRKNVLCAFLRIMLYGPSVVRRDLGSIDQFMPVDGKPMMGRMEIEWNGRDVTIQRNTGAGEPMQEFVAYYTDTGERCRLLTAKNCGQVLLGMSEDDFVSNMLVTGEDLVRPAAELQQQLLSMTHTGDSGNRAEKALAILNGWCDGIGREQGELDAMRQQETRLAGQLSELERLTKEIHIQKENCRKLGQQAAKAQDAYETAHKRCEVQVIDTEARRRNMREDREQRIHEIKKRVPDEALVRKAGEALYGYEGAVRLEAEKRESMPAIETRRRQAMERMEQARVEREIEVDRVTRPKIRWIAGAFALIFAILAAATGIVQVEWFPQMAQIAGLLDAGHLPVILSALAMGCLLLTFVGSVQKPPAPLPDIDEERKQLEIEYQQILDEQQMAASVLQEEQKRIIAAGRTLSPEVNTVEQATNVIRSALADLQLIRREQSALGDIILEIQRAPDEDPLPADMRQNLEQLLEERNDSQQALDMAREQLAQVKAQADAIGTLDDVRGQLSDCKAQIQVLEKQYAAAEHARQIITEENAALKQRISPDIISRAQSYLSFLTVDPEAETEQENTWSAGTPDQLYLALRLAICQSLGTKDAPLILNDPFITADESRTDRGIALLRVVARQRQVILLT
ncbi:MAG: hypothetical protein KHY89_06650 [Butyricicoccus pullicaecorum]|nr:hypothetical protein [Butyricicoccus pullicaecorum]